MRIDLKETRAFVITCGSQRVRRNGTVTKLIRGQFLPGRDRKAHMTAQLSQLGIPFTLVEGIACNPGIIGCGLSHLKVLSKAMPPPFIVFEDDCSVTEAYQSVLEIPDQADAVYLGVSSFGIQPEISQSGIRGATLATDYNSHFLQIHNMLSAHAILYLSQRFIDAARTAILEYLLKDRPFDLGLATLQQQFLVLAPRQPFFYQDRRFGGLEAATKEPLSPAVEETQPRHL